MPPRSQDPNGNGADQRPSVDGPGADDGPAAKTARELAEEAARERRLRRGQRRERRRAAWQRAKRAFAERRRSRAAAKDAGPRLKKLRLAIVFSGLTLLAVVSWVFGVMMAVAQELPDLEARAQYDSAENSVVLANDGTEITTLTGNEKRILVDSEDISPLIKQAVVAIEDERFYEHRGIDYLGIARALQQDIVAGGAVQGGSTITQQFVKNALEAQGSRTVLQKLREAALAYQIERQWSKDKILTNYLNNIYFGEGAYGVEAAARTFFGSNHPGCGGEKDRCASVLAPEEAAMLAGMISSPDAYSPSINPEDATARRNIVLEKMREQGVLDITESEFAGLIESALPDPDSIEPPADESEAPYYTSWLRQQVVDRYGAGQAFGGGLEIKSTLDLDLQRAAEDSVASRLSGLGPTSAVVVLDNETAGVLAMVGGDDFEKDPFNLATNGRRQPGSAFKPFTLVAALKEGYSPDQVYESRPIEIPFEANIVTKSGERKQVTDLFRVNNYEDSYAGSASIATATTTSDNSVYAQLGTDVGVNDVVGTARALGVQSRIPDNPAVILGGLKRGVTPLEMAYAYNTIANDGERVSGSWGSRKPGRGPVGIEKVLDADGEPVPDAAGGSGENEITTKQVIEPGVAEQARELLRGVVTSGTGLRAQVGDQYIWGKTGTTDNNADAWFVGANDEITVAVWVGYADGSTPMLTEYGGLPVDGGTIPALIWNDVVTAYSELNPEEVSEEEVVPVTTTTTPTIAPEATTTPVEPVEPAPVEPAAPAPEAPPAPAAPEGDAGAAPESGGAVPEG